MGLHCIAFRRRLKVQNRHCILQVLTCKLKIQTMDEFETIIRSEGWEFNPDSDWQHLAWQYWNMGEKLSRESLQTTDIAEWDELRLAAADYRNLSDFLIEQSINK